LAQKNAGPQKNAGEQQAEQALKQSQRELEQMAQKQNAAGNARALTEKLAQIRAALARSRGGQQGDRRGESNAGNDAKRARVLDLDRFSKLSRGQGGQGDQGDSTEQPGDKPDATAAARAGGSDPRKSGDMANLGQMPGKGEGASEGENAGLGGTPGRGNPTRLSAEHETQRVTGQDGQGPTRSEIIREAGQRGFASRSYEKVHAEYARHAESVLESERVPAGYRFYVKRYFQLIRPRDEEAP
jgi:hypothetical protein